MSKTRRVPSAKHHKRRTPPALPPPAFICPECGRPYGDALYHGPAGHAPPELCLDCWAWHWARWEALMAAWCPSWKRLDVALWLLCQGDTHGEAAESVGRSPRTIRRWILRMRRGQIPTPGWLVQMREKAAGKL